MVLIGYHTTENIKTMKTGLVGGYIVAFRKDNTVIWARQGPDSRKRTAPFGVALSVISGAHEHSDLAKRLTD